VVDELTVEELSAQTGISIRNLRFYTTRGLVPPPTKRGRSAVYHREHVARFELLQELQAHGLSLSAIEKFFAGIPDDATPEQIALQSATLRPLGPAEPTVLTRRQLDARAGRTLTNADLDDLTELGAIVATSGRFSVSEGRLRAALTMMERGIPTDLALACNRIYQRHSKAMAEELEALFRESLWPAYKSGELGADQMVTMLDHWEQAGVTTLVEAFSDAITETRRAIIARRAGA
jgi:DNA-binding transcriptional MerR regulator